MAQKITLILCLSVILGFAIPFETVKAQKSSNLNLVAGVNIAQYANAPSGQDPRIGFSAGIYLPLGLPFPGWTFQPGIFYTQKGVKEQGVTAKVDYIQIPALAKVAFSRGGNATPYLLLGPYFSFVLEAEAENPDGSTTRFDNAESDFGLIGGLGLDFSLPGTSLFLEARYEAGLSDAFGEGLIIALDANDWQNRVLAIAVGVRI